jgi:hypothetical protein
MRIGLVTRIPFDHGPIKHESADSHRFAALAAPQ